MACRDSVKHGPLADDHELATAGELMDAATSGRQCKIASRQRRTKTDEVVGPTLTPDPLPSRERARVRVGVKVVEPAG